MFVKMMKNVHRIFRARYVHDRIEYQLIYHEALGFANGTLWQEFFDEPHFHALQPYLPKNRKNERHEFKKKSIRLV